MKKVKFGVKGMTCSACVAHVERAARSVFDGEVTVSLLSSVILLTVPDDTDEAVLRASLTRALRAAGYDLTSAARSTAEVDAEYRRGRRVLVLSLVFSALLMVVSMLPMAVTVPLPAALRSHRGLISVLLQLFLCLHALIGQA